MSVDKVPHCCCKYSILCVYSTAARLYRKSKNDSERERARALSERQERARRAQPIISGVNELSTLLYSVWVRHTLIFHYTAFILSLSHFMSFGTKRNSFTYNFHNSFHAAQAIIILDTFLNISFPHSLPGAFWPFSTSKLLLNIYF